MKKTLLLGLLLLGSLTVFAQDPPNGLDDGSQAPDFTVTDINDNVHHLQSYLDEGKTVILYCSAVWCGPCWSYHQTHALSDIYHAYGPEGSDEVVVLYVETDPRTQEGELDGTDLPDVGGDTYDPIGNWIEGTPYPIMNSDEISEEYVINFFPTIYRICPQGVGQPGITKKIEREAPAGLVTQINDGCTVLEGSTTNWGRVTGYDVRFCTDEGTVIAYVEGYGQGLTSATVQLKKDGAVIETKTFELETGHFEVAEIVFDTELGDGGMYEAVLTHVNGEAALDTFPEFLNSGEFNLDANAAVESSQNLFAVVHTDEWPAEMAWGIFNSADPAELVAVFDYNQLGADPETTYTHYITLEDTDCYHIVLVDAYGDGWALNEEGEEVPHGITIYAGSSDQGEVVFHNDGDFGARLDLTNAFVTNGTMGNEGFNDATFAIYPNPSNGTFNFATEQVLDVTVLDITGKVVHTQGGITNGGVMNLGQLQAGVYIAKVKGENNAERIEKLVIK